MNDDHFVCDTLLSAEPAVVQKSTKTRKAIIGASVIGVVAMLVVACSGQQATETDATDLMTVEGMAKKYQEGKVWEGQMSRRLAWDDKNIADYHHEIGVLRGWAKNRDAVPIHKM